MRWKITIEYDGSPYAGFQIQPDQKTVQGEIEKALYKFCQQEISITVAGRTDAGVHALGQIAHFDLDYRFGDGRSRKIGFFEMAKAINAHLCPQPIAIIDAHIVSDDFHARFGAKTKQYRYDILNRPYPAAIHSGKVWWVKKSLDIEAMEDAAQILIGEHDFSSFRDSNCQAKSPIRSIDAIWIDNTPLQSGKMISIYVEGRSFLHHQIRNIAGSLSMVGEGKWSKEDLRQALLAKDRTKGGPTAPSDGLFMVKIDYDE